MPRPKTDSRTALVDSALATFWKTGYHVVSMADLVRETGVSRGGIYSDFAGKRELFHACLQRYQDTFVLPSLAPVYAQGAGISAIKQYLDTIIAALKQLNGPSIGCLVVNTLAQLEVEDIETRALLEEHFKRQEDAILTAITNENNKSKKLTAEEAEELGRFAVISLQGLSVRFRNATDFEPIEQFTRTFISILETQVGNN